MNRIVNGSEWEALCKRCGIVSSSTPKDVERYVAALQELVSGDPDHNARLGRALKALENDPA